MLTVWKLDRLGRSLRDLIALLDDLKAQGVAFQSLTEAIDTETPTGRAMWQMVGILAELERSLIQERTKAGRAAAVARGVRMGRKRLLSAQQVAHARKLIEQGEGPDNVAQSLNVSRRTLYRALAAQMPASKKASKNNGQNWTLCCILSILLKLALQLAFSCMPFFVI